MTPPVIVVGTDGSVTADAAVRRAGAVALAEGGLLHLVTAFGRPDRHVREQLAAVPAEHRWMATPGPAAESVLRRGATLVPAEVEVVQHARLGDPVEVLLAVADQVGADVIVVGNVGMSGLPGYVRPSVPNRIAHRARCDVLIVATDGAAA